MIDPSPDGQVQVVPASWRDLGAVRHLEQVCFPEDAWPLLEVIGVLAMPGILRLKVELDDQLVGFVAVDIRRRENLAWIATIGVLPAYRRRGLGRTMMEACEDMLDVRRIRLSVRASNQAAIALYQRLGYRQTGIWPKYYQGRENAIVMEKQLPE